MLWQPENVSSLWTKSKIFGVQAHRRLLPIHHCYLPHHFTRFEKRREQKVTNINSGTPVLKKITSQNHWHVASTKTFICFVQSLTHGHNGEGGKRE